MAGAVPGDSARPGDRWVQTREMLKTINLEHLEEAAKDWDGYLTALTRAESGMEGPRAQLRSTNLIGDSRDPLYTKLGEARESLSTMRSQLEAKHPGLALRDLATYVDLMRK